MKGKSNVSFNKAAARGHRLLVSSRCVVLLPPADLGGEGRELYGMLASTSGWRGDGLDALGGDKRFLLASLGGEGKKKLGVSGASFLLVRAAAGCKSDLADAEARPPPCGHQGDGCGGWFEFPLLPGSDKQMMAAL